jgi:hypothetical protein
MEKQSSFEAASLLSLCAGAAAKLLWPKLRALLRLPALQTMQAHPVLARCLSQIAQRIVDPDEGAAPADAADRQLLCKLLCAVVMHEGGGESPCLRCWDVWLASPRP